jgi:nucleotide-binding universal stress UspA family protein
MAAVRSTVILLVEARCGRPPGALARQEGGSMFGTIVVGVDGSGHADRAVETVAKSHQAGLIVVGTRGRSNVTSMLLGSVAHEVVHKSTLPVLVVPEKAG